MIKVFQLKPLTKDERDQLNGADGGWDSSERFTRYANITSMAKHGDIETAVKCNEYRQVASVHTDDLNEAFRLTNHIEHSWQLNGRVHSLCSNARSTSVGDIMLDGDGVRHVVASHGFEELK